MLEQRETTPVLFGWGGNLSAREREGLKERIALFTGIAIAAIVAGLIGWGLLYDNVIKPANESAQNNKQVAAIGNYVINLGFFKRYQAFENKQFNDQITQYQGQLATLQADPKTNAAQITAYNGRISALQQALSDLPNVTLNSLIDNQAMLQRAKTVGVVATPQDVKREMLTLRNSFGGPVHFKQWEDQTGLTPDEIQQLQVAQFLRGKLQPVLARKVVPFQNKVRASHILVPTKKKALADQLYQRALKGANFAALAKKYSTDPGSGKKGGDLGYFSKDRMVAPFANKAFSMKVGQIGIVRSQFGWHIIKVTGRQRLHMTATELQTARSNALQTWLQTQRSDLHLQRFMNVATLPNLATPAAVATAPVSLPTQTVPGRPVVGTPGIGIRPRPVTHPSPITQPAKPTKSGNKP